jgi:hypothetical protein
MGIVGQLNKILDEAVQRHTLKEIVWVLYQDPEMVKKAIKVLEELMTKEAS